MIKLIENNSIKEVVFRPTPNHCRLYTRANISKTDVQFRLGAYKYYPDSVAKAKTIGPSEVSHWDDT